MKIKRFLKRTGKYLERALTDQRPQAPEKIIDLNGKLSTQKSFAALGGIKGATNRARRRVQKAAKDRLKHGLLSQEAVDRLTQREVKKAVQKAEIPLHQDINNAVSSTVKSIKNTPQTLRTTATKAKGLVKNIYENTGDVTAKTAGWARKNPELFVGDVVIGLASKPAAFAVSPALGGALMASPVGPGKVATAGLYALRKSPNKVVEYGGKKMTMRRKRTLQGREVENAIKKKIGGKSIKGGVEKIKQIPRKVSSVLSLPQSPNVYPRPVIA